MPTVAVVGLKETRAALKKLAPTILKEMNKEIIVVLKEIVIDAKSKVPSSMPEELHNWNDNGKEHRGRVRARAFPRYDAAKVKKGIKYSAKLGKNTRTGFRAAYSIINESAAGSIIETAGRKSGSAGDPESQSNNPSAGSHFIKILNAHFGSLKRLETPVGFKNTKKEEGRLLIPAINRNGNRARDAIVKAITKAERRFNEGIRY
jgi:hypothetical protein